MLKSCKPFDYIWNLYINLSSKPSGDSLDLEAEKHKKRHKNLKLENACFIKKLQNFETLKS